jgi:transcriptional regulator with XRE-family HTH domain
MPSVAEALRTGDDAVPVRLERRAASRFAGVPLPVTTPNYYSFPLVITEWPTGNDTWQEPTEPVRNWVSLIELAEDSTGYGWVRAPLLRAYTGGGVSVEIDETTTREDQERTVIAASIPVHMEVLPARTPEGDAAARIRELTGLQIEKLAELFGVSRGAYYNWLNGTRPRGDHRDRLLFAQQLLEEAARILGEPREVGAWLISPSPASGRVPIDLLKNGQYDLCRSLLTRSGARRKALPVRTKRHLAGEDLRAEMRRISPAPAIEDVDEPGPSIEDPDRR